MKICENCGNPHDGSYGSGRFCCQECARSFSSKYVSEEGRQRQAKALNDPENRKKCKSAIKRKNDEKRKELEEKYKEKRKYKNNDANLMVLNKSNLNITSSLFKGKIGEYKTIEKFLKHGVPVYIPIVDTGIDMIININGEYKTVQVKSSSNTSGVNNDKIIFKITRNKRTISSGTYEQVAEAYNTDEIDYFSLYNLLNDDLYLIKNSGDPITNLTIRCNQIPQKTQTVNGNYDVDLDFDAVLDEEINGLDMINIIPGEYREV